MAAHSVLAVAGVAVVGLVDGVLIARVLRAYRSSRRRPHLVIAAGVAASFLAVIGCSIVLAAQGTPGLRDGAWWPLARALCFVGAGLAYGLVGLFATSAFGRSRWAEAGGVSAIAALVGLAIAGLRTHGPEVATPATLAWELRVPFVGIAVAGSSFGAARAASLARAYSSARRRGRQVDPVALGRMRLMARGFLAMAGGQLPILVFEPRGRFDDALGLTCVGAILLGALGFTLACVGTWATPQWLRARWEAA